MWSTQIPVTFNLLASAACISLLSGCAILGYECPDDDITCYRDADLGFGPNSDDYDRADRYRKGEPGGAEEGSGPGDVAASDPAPGGPTTGSDDTTVSDDTTSVE